MIAWGEVKSTAARLLNFNYENQIDDLFYEHQWPINIKSEPLTYKAGTPEYAAVVAKRIDQFISEQGW